jgi:hypothetical protein
LEGWTHERVARAGLVKDSEMDIEERKVNSEGDYDKSNGPCTKVLPEVFLATKSQEGNILHIG